MQPLALLAAFSALATAHMEMSHPPPLRSKFNRYTTNIDYSMTSPLLASGANYPCKGYHKLLNSPQGRPVVTWEAGQSYNISIVGGASHAGGSCQVSLSYDRGATWTAIHSYIGGCPLTKNWVFTLPEDTPAGNALFAWSWFNRVGNREMYMNCAHVTIQSADMMGDAAGEKKRSPYDSIYDRPAMFVANVRNGCSTREGTDVVFPNPGPDVDNISQKPAAPVGRCR